MKTKLAIGIAAGVLAAVVVGWWHFAQSDPTTPQHILDTGDGNASVFSFQDYAAVLKVHVDERGMVNYEDLKAQRQRLDSFIAALGTADPEEYDTWDEKEQIALWINAYNALTLVTIIDHYPIEPVFFELPLLPENSIRQIPGVWDQLQFTVIGRKLTLDQIEHEILRKEFSEPRVHMALVCAAISCPPLRNEPFAGHKLDNQLDDQTRRFLSGPWMFRIERDRRRVFLSSIFDWYGEDFVRPYGTNEKFAGHSPAERAVLNFVSRYLDVGDREYLAREKYKIKYLYYDWSLNKQGEVTRLS